MNILNKLFSLTEEMTVTFRSLFNSLTTRRATQRESSVSSLFKINFHFFTGNYFVAHVRHRCRSVGSTPSGGGAELVF